MRNFIEQQEIKLKKSFGYIFRCDDKRRPKEFASDIHFGLWEFDKVSEVTKIFEDLNLNYDLVIEEFSTASDEVEYQIEIKNSNWRNDTEEYKL